MLHTSFSLLSLRWL
uniref:Uncharacterized protein n=1 Tax=Arundo donax TaxID=35708 RepID=A0A0A8Y2Z1_ARUDO